MIVSDHKGTEALAAYVAFLQHLSQPVKDARANTGTFSYTYLSLPKLLEHIARDLREAGLAIGQEDVGDADTVQILTTVVHLQGGWLSFGPTVFPAPADPQKRGAVISYARRYSLLAALGLAAEDDDAASATGGTVEVHGEGGRSGTPVVEDSQGGAGAALGGSSPVPSSDDKAATQRAHQMITSPHAPGLQICARDGCSFNRRAA
jgi:hypothetical protein